MTTPNLPKMGLWTAGLALCLGMTSCSAAPQTGDLARVQQLTTSCKSGTVPAGLVRLDGTGSTQSPELLATRFAAVEDLATVVAACDGHLRVDIFTSSSSAAAVLFDGDLAPVGATDIAKRRSVLRIAGEVQAAVEEGYEAARAALPQDATDVVASLAVGEEYINQLNRDEANYVLSELILTDGVHNSDLTLTDPELSVEEAERIAESVEAPDLSGSSVTFAGIGRMSGDQPTTRHSEALKAFYKTLCSASGASSCTVVTEYMGR